MVKCRIHRLLAIVPQLGSTAEIEACGPRQQSTNSGIQKRGLRFKHNAGHAVHDGFDPAHPAHPAARPIDIRRLPN